jgi:FtsH-binding integral membrane protein
VKAATVWARNERTHVHHAMSKNLFAFAISAFTLAGIVTSMVAAQFSKDWTFPTIWHLVGFFVGVLVAGIAGVIISLKSEKPAVSLFGYALVAVPFGLMLGPVLATYTTASIVKVLFITSALVAVLGIVGAMIPDSLEGWGSWLMGGLVILLVGYLVVPITGALGVDVQGAMTWLDWAGVALFSGMVIYDWNRAMRLPRTLDNSIDAAVAVYLDWFNLFIRLLSIMGGRTSD